MSFLRLFLTASHREIFTFSTCLSIFFVLYLITFLGRADSEGYENCNYLWQVFFTNPYEWRDLRKCKVNPRQPDFTHKDTGEALWLSPNDPPWIKRQLQLLDTQMAEQGQGDFGLRSRVSMWVYDE